MLRARQERHYRPIGDGGCGSEHHQSQGWPFIYSTNKGLGRAITKGPQTELAATPVLLTRHLCVAFILLSLSGQCTESQPPAEPARNSGQACPEMGGWALGTYVISGRTIKGYLCGEEVQGDIINL